MAVAVLGEAGEDHGRDVAEVDWFGDLVSHVGHGEEGVGGGVGEDVEFGGCFGEAFGWGSVVEVDGGLAGRFAGEGKSHES
mgnify:FL=1